MESFRRVIKGWLGKVLLVLFLTPLALVGIEGYFGGGNKEDLAAEVDGQKITKKELADLTKNQKQQYLSLVNGDETLLNQKFIQNNVLDYLIHRDLLAQQAKKLGIALSDAQIEQMLSKQPSFQQNGQFSSQLFENYLRSVNMTRPTLIANIRNDHATQMLRGTVLDGALVSQQDVGQIANLQNEQRSIYLSSIKLDDYKKNVTVSANEIQQYFNQHQADFKKVANVDVSFVVLPTTAVKTDAIQVSDAELKQAYDKFVASQNKNAKREVKHILITKDAHSDAEAQKIANDVYAKIQAGLPFAKAAQQYSEDSGSKAQGGLVAGYAPGLFSAAFDQAVLALQANQISKPVKTQYGYHIIQVAQISGVATPSFESQKARLLAEVKKAKATNVYTDTVNSLNELVVGSDSLDVIAEQMKTVQVQSLKGFTAHSRHPYLSDVNVKAKLFSEDVINGDRNASSNIQLANGDTLWFKVLAYHAAGEQTLAEASAKIKNELIEEKASAAAKAKLANAIKAFATQPAAQASAASGLKFENAGTFVRSQGLKREIERAAFSVQAPKAGFWSVTTAALPNELVLVAVANVAKAAVLTPEQTQELKQLYTQLRGQQELEDYSNYLKAKAKVKQF